MDNEQRARELLADEFEEIYPKDAKRIRPNNTLTAPLHALPSTWVLALRAIEKALSPSLPTGEEEVERVARAIQAASRAIEEDVRLGELTDGELKDLARAALSVMSREREWRNVGTEHWAGTTFETRVERDARTSSRERVLEEALKPFAADDFEHPVVDEHGWTDFGVSWSRERIVDWFGPSDFRRAVAAIRSLKTQEEGE